MNAGAELKIIFAGPMGAGKTTAIAVVSDAKPLSTEVTNNDQATYAKETTTVGLDYGELTLDQGTVVRLYGAPGQERFSFMWDILGRGAMAVILLFDASSATAISDLHAHLQAFTRIAPGQPLVIGIGRARAVDDVFVAACNRTLSEQGLVFPVFSVDVRVREDVVLLIETSLSILQSRLQGRIDDAA